MYVNPVTVVTGLGTSASDPSWLLGYGRTASTNRGPLTSDLVSLQTAQVADLLFMDPQGRRSYDYRLHLFLSY